MRTLTNFLRYRYFLVSVLLLFNAAAVKGQLSGNYTIDPTGSGSTNYTTFTSAVSALKSVGVSGPVIFQVAADSFNENITINKITGASATNTITFKGAGMYSTVLWYQTGASTVLLTDTAGYIRFKDMTIDDPDQNGTAIQLDRASHHIKVDNCYLTTVMGTGGNILLYLINGAHHNQFNNNVLTGGYYSVYANYTSYGDSNSFTGNDVSGFYNYGFYFNYQQNFELNENVVHAPGYQYAYAFYMNYSRKFKMLGNTTMGTYAGLLTQYAESFNIRRNQFLDCGYYGMYFYQGNNGSTDTSYVVNNMVSSTQPGYTLYMYQLNRTFFYHNSFYGGNPYYGLYMDSGSGNEFINNSVEMTAQYYGIYVYGSPFNKFDYNNLYLSGLNGWAYWGSVYSNLAALKAGQSSYNQHSISVDPEYKNRLTNLHTDGQFLNNKGFKLAAVPYDFDGDPRPFSPDTSVDIGADEIYVADYDLDVESVDAPNSLILTGNNVVQATFRNMGKSALSSMDVKVAYSYNGTTWTEDTLHITSLAPGARQSLTFTKPFTISSAGTYNICVRITQQITGDPDASDQKCKTACDGRSGTIIVDATGNGDHKTIKGALDELQCGLIGPVTIKIRPGTYNETITISQIFGLSSTNTVTIEGAGTDSVFIVQSSGSVAVTLNKVSYITIKDVSIQAIPGSTGVKITSGSSNNHIEDNIINIGSSTNSNAVGVMIGSSYSSGTNDNNNNIIKGNEIYGGYFGITCYGASNALGGRVVGNKFIDNTVKDQYYYGLYLYYNRDMQVVGNKLLGTTYTSGGYGISAYYNNKCVYEKNVVSGYNYSAFMWYYENYTNAQSGDTSRVINNMFGGNTTYQYGYGVYAVYCNNVKFYHNSVIYMGTGYYAMIVQYGSWDMQNNNISHAVATNSSYYSFYFYGVNWIALDYNNYDYQTSQTFYITGTLYSSLADWQSAQPMYNQHSTNIDPNFLSTTDLHLSFGSPFPSGAKVGVTEDIDGDPRCLLAPTIGADESRFPVPPPVAGFLAPDTAWINSQTTFYNQASKNDNYFYSWYVNGVLKDNSLNFANTFTSAGTYNIKLVTEGCSGIDSVTKTVVVSLPTRAPKADFIADHTETVVFAPIQLNDLSQYGPTSWEWIITPDSVLDPLFGFKVPTYYFSKGNQISQNPSVVFEYPGTYSICLVASNVLGSDTVCYSDYITVLNTVNMCLFPFDTDEKQGILYDDGGALANYSAGKTGFNKCYYTINSCGGDVELNLEEFQLNSGDYLRVYDGTSNKATPLWDAASYSQGMTGGLSDKSVTTTLVATSGRMYIEFESDANTGTTGPGFKAVWRTIPRQFANPQADFMLADTFCVDIPIEFRNASIGGNLTYRWDVMADSTFESTAENFEYTFKTTGKFPVRLHVANCAGIDTLTKWVVIENVSKKPVPDFAVSNTKPAIGTVVQLTDLTDYCVTNYKWRITPSTYFFANQTSSTSRHPEVVFNAPGFYDVKLVVTNPQGSDSILKQQVIHVISYCKPAVVNLNNELGISRVKLATMNNNVLLNNASKIGETEYTNYTSTHKATLALGSSYIVTLERLMANNAMNRAVWIDFNRDGDFDDAGELVGFESSALTLAWSDTISIPLTAESGATRMRIGTNKGGNANLPCGPNLFGEYEDYGLILMPDDEPPVISLNDNDTLYIEQCRSYMEPGATAMDNVDGDISSSIVISGTVDTCVTGNYTISYDVTDASGNAAKTVTRLVIVDADTTKPVITLSPMMSDTIEVKTPFVDPGYSATDNVDGSLTSSVVVTGSVNSNIVGVYVLTYTVTDVNGNSAQATRKVWVLDRTDPLISLKGKKTDTIGVNTSWVDQGVTISDNYDDVSELILTTTGAVDSSTIGIYNITYCVTDSSGNGPVCVVRTITVSDTSKPVANFKTPNDSLIIVEVFNQFIDPGLSISDNDSAFIVSIGGTWPGNSNTLGFYTLVYTISDPSGNITVITRRIHVVDHTAPVLSMNPPLIDTVMRWSVYNDPGYSVADNYYPTSQIIVDRDNQVNTQLPGIYTITYQAEDPSGNQSPVAHRTVVVVNPLGIAEREGDIKINIYPNPTSDRFRLDVVLPEREEARISVINMIGEEISVVDQAMLKEATYQVDLSGKSSGIYFIRIVAGDKAITRKVVLQNR